MYDITKIDCDDEYNPQSVIEVEVQTTISRSSRFLDSFIEFVRKESPDILTKTLNRFKDRLTGFEHANLDHVSFDKTPKNFEAFPDIFRHIRAVSLSLLRYNECIATEKDGKISVTYWNYVRSYLIPLYHLAQTLVDVVPREQGIDLYQRSVDYETDQTEKIDESITCLEDFFRLAFSKGTPALSRITFLTEKGIAGVKITRCLWVDILKEFDDPKISYAVACHYDLHAARYINKNFRLTRKKTLMQGNGFCDFCWHDISIDKEMKHLSDDFWQELDDLAKNRSRL